MCYLVAAEAWNRSSPLAFLSFLMKSVILTLLLWDALRCDDTTKENNDSVISPRLLRRESWMRPFSNRVHRVRTRARRTGGRRMLSLQMRQKCSCWLYHLCHTLLIRHNVNCTPALCEVRTTQCFQVYLFLFMCIWSGTHLADIALDNLLFRSALLGTTMDTKATDVRLLGMNMNTRATDKRLLGMTNRGKTVAGDYGH